MQKPEYYKKPGREPEAPKYTIPAGLPIADWSNATFPNDVGGLAAIAAALAERYSRDEIVGLRDQLQARLYEATGDFLDHFPGEVTMPPRNEKSATGYRPRVVDNTDFNVSAVQVEAMLPEMRAHSVILMRTLRERMEANASGGVPQWTAALAQANEHFRLIANMALISGFKSDKKKVHTDIAPFQDSARTCGECMLRLLVLQEAYMKKAVKSARVVELPPFPTPTGQLGNAELKGTRKIKQRPGGDDEDETTLPR